MRIDKIYISAFGGLKDFSLEFGEGLNVIYGKNEQGKTTVMAFIKAMFYGTGGKVKDLQNSIRERYTPWDGSTMGGRIYFTAGGKGYCLEKEFRKSDSTDRRILTELSSGEQEKLESDIGFRFLGLSAESFEKSVFISSFITGVSSDAAGELNSKLSNIAITGDETVSHKKIDEKLVWAKEKIISKSGRTGSFVKGSEALDALSEALKDSRESAKKQLLISEGIAKAKAKLSELLKAQSRIKTLLSAKEDLKSKDKLTQYLALKEELEQKRSDILMGDGKELDANVLKFCLSKAELADKKAEQLSEKANRLKQEIELSSTLDAEGTKIKLKEMGEKTEKLESENGEIEGKIKALTEKCEDLKQEIASSKSSKKPFNPLLLILGIIALVLGIAVLFINPIIAPALSFAAIIFLLLSFILKPQNKTLSARLEATVADTLNQTAALRELKSANLSEITALSGKMNLLSAALNTDTAIKQSKEADLLALEQEIKAALEEKEISYGKLYSLLGTKAQNKSKEEITKLIDLISKNNEEIKGIKISLNLISKDLGNISYSEARQKLDAIKNNLPENDVNYQQLEAENDKIQEEISDINSSITAGEVELKTAFRSFKNPESIEREINLLKEDLNAQKDFYDAATIASEVLYESFLEIRKGYGTKVEKRTLEIFSLLSEGRYSAVNVSKELELTVEQSGIFGTREIGYLSRGTKDQAYLSLRLAIAELMAGDEPLPIMLDDVLSQYDDARCAAAITFLKEYSKDSQALLFTCHDAVVSNAKENDIEVRPLRG